MELISVEFEKNLILCIKGHNITITPFKSEERSSISVGIEAPRTLAVNREEIYKKKQEQLRSREGQLAWCRIAEFKLCLHSSG